MVRSPLGRETPGAGGRGRAQLQAHRASSVVSDAAGRALGRVVVWLLVALSVSPERGVSSSAGRCCLRRLLLKVAVVDAVARGAKEPVDACGRRCRWFSRLGATAVGEDGGRISGLVVRVTVHPDLEPKRDNVLQRQRSKGTVVLLLRSPGSSRC